MRFGASYKMTGRCEEASRSPAVGATSTSPSICLAPPRPSHPSFLPELRFSAIEANRSLKLIKHLGEKGIG